MGVHRLRWSLIRQVDPASLHTVEGWNAALRAQRGAALDLGGPLWQRGDGAVPVETDAGHLFGCADTWVLTVTRHLARNTYVRIDPAGRVAWLRSEGSELATIVPDPSWAPGSWWWPSGGIPDPDVQGRAILMGEVWKPGPGFGIRVGTAAVQVAGLDGPNPFHEEVGLVVIDAPQPDTSIRWGDPYLADGIDLVMVGYSTEPRPYGSLFLARCPAAMPDLFDVESWTVTPLQLERPPLERLRITPWRDGWLLSGKVLSSAPGLGYQETPGVAAWFAKAITGPYKRLPDLVNDTTRPGWPSYGAGACWLPHVGLVAQWSRNGDASGVYDVDSYGPVLARATVPPWE